MAHESPQDAALRALEQAEIQSAQSPTVTYRVGPMLEETSSSVAFRALRVAPDGQCDVVLKIFRPAYVRAIGDAALLPIKKEGLTLVRLSERSPASPFVVGVVEAGTVSVPEGGGPLDVPWLVLEHIHGGVEGATLEARVSHSVRTTGYAFDPARAARAVDCMARGLAELHDAGLVHKAVQPQNVFACGFGDEELFKIASYGVAHLAPPLSGVLTGPHVGVAPELAQPSEGAVGPWTDVFGLAAVIFHLLTGEPYFPMSEDSDLVEAARRPRRRSISECAALVPEIGEREAACRAIDEALAWATAPQPEERPPGARALAANIVPWLRGDARRPRAVTRRLEAVVAQDAAPASQTWTWRPLHRARDGRIIRHVAWNADLHCLAATDRGLAFWNGVQWRDASLQGLPEPAGIRFVRRVAPGRWLVGGDAATFAVVAADGVREVVRGADPTVRFDLFSGSLDDLAVVVGVTSDGRPVLYALAGRRWLKPLPMDDVAALGSIARIGDERWLLAGRTTDRAGFVGVYSPLEWEVSRLETPPVRAFLRCAAQPDRQLGLAVGAEGAVVWLGPEGPQIEVVDAEVDLSAAAVDVIGRGWTAGAGRIWTRDPGGGWRPAWHDAAWTTPIVSMFADAGVVVAMTASGDVLEGIATEG